ncbi:MAG TPA: hypothetical protein VEI02_15270 [Planctomycetota bacterium]|nr:hypothetical protein [Planctomycetota bacterium]
MRPFLAVVALASVVVAQESAPAFRWRRALPEARAEAARDGRPLCVVFRCEA